MSEFETALAEAAKKSVNMASSEIKLGWRSHTMEYAGLASLASSMIGYVILTTFAVANVNVFALTRP